MKNILKDTNQVEILDIVKESEITEELDLENTLKSERALRPISAYSSISKQVYEGGDSAADLLDGVEDGGDGAAVLGGKAKPIGGGDHEDPLTAFLTQVPPDWELAEKHGMANLVLYDN